MKVLVKAGCDLLKRDITGVAPLHYAARFNLEEVLKYLLSLGTEPNIRTTDGSTALHVLAKHGSILVIPHLLDASADLELLNNHRISPFEVAVSSKNLNTVKALID
jgi:ankyrin repeat protein